MQHYIITCLDKDDAREKRIANYDAHKAYLDTKPIRIVISGPLPHDTEDYMIGSHFVVEADSLDEVVTFNRNDPFNQAGVWGDIKIRRFIKRMDNR